MIVAVGAISCLVSSWIMSHLGRKPVRGGRPARDRRDNIRVALSAGVFVQVVISVDSFRVLIEFSIRNTAVVIRVYK